MSDFKSMITALARELENESNAGFDLWTWLPSYRKAQKHHGDYASEHMPTTANIMDEACEYICLLVEGKTPEEIDKMDNEWFDCPCGEAHDDEV